MSELEKGRKAYPIGTVRNGRKKMPNGQWKPVKGQKDTNPEKKKEKKDSSIEATMNEVRKKAADAYKEMKKTEYAFARESDISNLGKDISGSARHKRNQWKNLEDAERQGIAEKLVTRDKLLKNEPFSLHEHVENNPLGSFLMFEAVKKFVTKPDTKKIVDVEGGYVRIKPSTRLLVTTRKNLEAYGLEEKDIIKKLSAEEYKKELREDYLNIFRELQQKAQEIASKTQNSGEDMQDFLRNNLSEIKEFVKDKIQSLRKERGEYNPLASQLAKYHNRTLRLYGRPTNTNLVGSIKNIFLKLKEAKEQGKLDEESFIGAIKSHMEGESVEDILGLEKKKKERFSRADMYVKVAERKGPETGLNTKEKQTDFLMNKAKLKAVQWGNSVTDEEREHHLEKLSNSFKDLSDVLNLPEEMISYNGRLGMAIGARGKARALAHYEHKEKVINLTRKNGVGSLAHEWGHMFDNVLNEIMNRKYADFMSTRLIGHDKEYIQKMVDSGEYTQEQGELMSSMNDIQLEMREFIRKELFNSDAYRRATPPTRKYLGSYHEVFARTFEVYIDKKLKDKGRKNTYLTGLDHDKLKENSIYPSKERMAKLEPLLDKFFEKFSKSSYLKKSFMEYCKLINKKEHTQMSKKETTKEVETSSVDEMKDLIKSILKVMPDELTEKALLEGYEIAKSKLESSEQAIHVMKSIVDKKYPKPKKQQKVELFKASKDVYSDQIENLKDLSNEALDFSEWGEDISETQKVIKANVEKMKKFETE